MSIQFIQKYYAEIDKIIFYGGNYKEDSLRNAFDNSLCRVCTVKLETMKIVREMPK